MELDTSHSSTSRRRLFRFFRKASRQGTPPVSSPLRIVRLKSSFPLCPWLCLRWLSWAFIWAVSWATRAVARGISASLNWEMSR